MIPAHRYDFAAFCDGASRRDGRGGWGAFIVGKKGRRHYLSGGDRTTTNNRMELTAALEALWYVPAGRSVLVVSDSQYVVRGATENVDMWLRTNWRTSTNKELKNKDLWQELLSALFRHSLVDWQWVRGHSGIYGNEMADRLARRGVEDLDT